MAQRHKKAHSLPVKGPIAAAVLRLSARHFYRLVRERVIPRDGRLFDLVKVVPAYLAYQAAGGAGSSEMADARLKLIQSQGRALDQRTRRESGKLVERAEVSRICSAAVVVFAAAVDGMSGRLAGELAAIDQPAQIHEVLADEARRIRNAAADELEKLAAHEPGASDAPAAEANRGPLGGNES